MARTTVSSAAGEPDVRLTGVPTRVLVFGMMRADGTVDAAELLPVAEACGQTPEQVRSCLRRLSAEGLLTRTGSGQRARYDATPAGMASSASVSCDAYSHTGASASDEGPSRLAQSSKVPSGRCGALVVYTMK